MRQLKNTILSKKILLVFKIFLFLALFFLNVTACSNNDEETTRDEYRPAPAREYTHEQGGSPTQPYHSDAKNIITVDIDQNTIYVDGLRYTKPEDAAEYLLSLKIETQKLIELNLKQSKAKTSEQFQRAAKAKGIFFNKIIAE